MLHATLRPERHACAECGGRLAPDDRHAELVCRTCGLVAPQPPALPRRDAPERPRVTAIPSRRVWDGARRPARGAVQARRHLNRLAHALHLPPHVAEDALRLVDRARRAGATQGRSLLATSAAALLEAARDRGTPRTVEAVAEAAGVDRHAVGRAQRALAKVTGQRVLPLGPARLLPAIAARANVPPRAQTRAIEMLQAHARDLQGRRPQPLVAAALLEGCALAGARCSVTALARAAGVSRQAVYDARAALAEARSRRE